MEDEFTECSTGILVDIEDKLDDKLSLMSLNVEKPENYILNGLNLNGGSNNKLLGAELNIRRDVFSTPKGGWKTPSPKSMRMINREAFRIIDHLHSSPIEAVEAQLIDEDFPTPFSLDGSSSESSPESENTCANCLNCKKNLHSLSKVTSATGCENESPFELEIAPINGVTKESPIQNEIVSPIDNKNESTIQNKNELPIQNKLESPIQNEIESLIENKKVPTIQNESDSPDQKGNESPIQKGNESPIQKGNESPIQKGNESPIQKGNESPIQMESPIQDESESSSCTEETVIQVEAPEDTAVSPTNMVQSTLESEPANKNELKTPLSKKFLGKENLSIKKDVSKLRFSNNQTGLGKRNLIEPNSFVKPSSVLNGKTPIKESFRKDKANAIPDKRYSAKKIPPQTPGGMNRRNSILPKLASTMPSLPGPSPVSALSKTSKLVTPVPGFVRRTLSFQSEKLVSKNPGSVALSVSSKNFQSGIGSIKKDSNPVTKSRLSICQIPSTGNPKYTPVSRSKSFPKSSGTFSSRISRPSLSGALKVDSAKPSQISDPDRSVLSTSSRIRFTSRLYLPSPLPDSMNMNLPRKLFPDVKPKKR